MQIIKDFGIKMNFIEFCKKHDLKLNNEQAEAVQHIDGPMLMISVPGSGKTAVIITRIAYMILCKGIPPDQILTVTFSADAADSMKKRFKDKFGDSMNISIMPEFRTVHSLAFRIIKLYCSVNNKITYKILKDPSYVIKKILKDDGYEYINDKTLKDIINRISKLRNMMSADQIENIIIDGVNIKALYGKYTCFKKERDLIDFDDMLEMALNILEGSPDILNSFKNKYKYFNVDEAQDNSILQNRIIDILSSENNNIFMAGDEDQCIYGFRGACPQSFFEFESKWGSESILKLETNYRSSAAILETAEKFISQNKNRYKKKLQGVTKDRGKVAVKSFDTMNELTEYIISDHKKYGNAAVLSRNNDSLIPIEYAFYKKHSSFNLRDHKNDFFDSVPIHDIISFIKSSLGIKEKYISYYLEPIFKNKTHLLHLKALPPSDAAEYILEDMFYSKILISKFKERHSSQEFCAKLNIFEYIAGHHIDHKSLLNDIEKFKAFINTETSSSSISFLTCHGSKGLEFDKVYLIDVTENIFPSGYFTEDDREEELEEEVRLFYVALTRARKEAEILKVNSSKWGMNFPSIFVKRVEGDIEKNGKK
ncbi:MAG: ATP-dependent helicase [Clostridiales bacterium]|nr:ATP-dependent helicase [Clostridiales bacterium]